MADFYEDPDLASQTVEPQAVTPPATKPPGIDHMAELDAMFADIDAQREAGTLEAPSGIVEPYKLPEVIDEGPIDGAIRSAKALGYGIYDAITDQAPEDFARQRRGGVDVHKDTWSSRVIAQQDKDREEVKAHRDSLTAGSELNRSLYEGPKSLVTSAIAGTTGMLAGAAAGSAVPVVGNVAGGMIGAGVLSGAAMYRQAKDQFLSQMYGLAKQQNPGMTDAEWESVAKGLESDATKYGLWEAGPEAASQALTAGLLKGVGGKIFGKIPGFEKITEGIARNAFARVGAKIGADVAGEEATELATFYGQGGIEKERGLRETDPTLSEFIREQAGPVAAGSLLGMGVMGGVDRVINPQPDAKKVADEWLGGVSGGLETGAVQGLSDEDFGKIYTETARVFNEADGLGKVSEDHLKTVLALEDEAKRRQGAPDYNPDLTQAEVGPELPDGWAAPAEPGGPTEPPAAPAPIVTAPDPVRETLAVAGLADKPEWQQATATFEALTGGQQSVEQAMGQPATPQQEQGVPGASLAPAVDAAFYDPAQVDATYQRRVAEAQAQAEAAQEAARVQAEAARAASAAPFPASMDEMGMPAPVAEAAPQAEAPAPKTLTAKEQKQATALAKRIDNLTKLLATENNPAARVKAEETRAGYEFELRSLTGETASVLTPEESARADTVRQEQQTPQAALPPGIGFERVGEPQTPAAPFPTSIEGMGNSTGPRYSLATETATPGVQQAFGPGFAARAEQQRSQDAVQYKDTTTAPQRPTLPAPVPKELADDISGRIDNLNKMLRVEKNQTSRLRITQTIQGYEQQLSDLFGMGQPQAAQAATPGVSAGNMTQPMGNAQNVAVSAANEVAPGPAPAAPVSAEGWKGHTTADVAKAFPKSTVTETDTGHRVDLPNGRVLLIDRAGAITIDRAAARAQGHTDAEIDRANAAGGAKGQFSMVNGTGVIQLTEAGKSELGHETMHFARVAALTKKQNAVLDKIYYAEAVERAKRTGQPVADILEEVIAERYNAWLAKRGADRTGLFAVIRRFFQNIRQAIAPTAEGVFEKTASGQVWSQKSQNALTSGNQYALINPGVNINDSEQPFTEQILSGNKTIETRDTDSLRPYVGRRIGIVQTGKGKAQHVGYTTVGEPQTPAAPFPTSIEGMGNSTGPRYSLATETATPGVQQAFGPGFAARAEQQRSQDAVQYKDTTTAPQRPTLPAPVFYSQMQRVLEKPGMLPKGTSARDMLAAIQKHVGKFKGVEFEESGLKSWLESAMTGQPLYSLGFADPAIEAEYQEGRKGIGDQRSFVARVIEWLKEQGHGFTRHFIHLPNEPRFSEAHEILRQLEAAPTAAQEQAIRNLKKITAALDPEKFDLFSRKVLLDDLAHEATLGHKMPFGFTPAAVASEKAIIDREAAASPEVTQALAIRKTIQDALAQRLVDAGILSQEQLQNPAYFRHEVLKYAREWQNSQGTGSSVKKPKPGYAKGREGSEEAINANYLEVEYGYMQRALTDLATIEAIDKIKAQYNIRPDLEKAAKEANNRALTAMGVKTKGMTEAEKRKTLGDRYKTWKNMIPEGYETFQVDKGLLYAKSNMLTDRAVSAVTEAAFMDPQAFQDQAPEIVLEILDGMRQGMRVIGKKPEIVLPKELTATLNNLRPKNKDGFFDKALAKPLGMWKQWMLINPRRVLKYNLNNMSGDIDAVIAGNWKALKKVPEAFRELRTVMLREGDPTQEYLDAVKAGVFDSGLSVQEIPDITSLNAFANLQAKAQGKLNLLGKGWGALQKYTQFRENILRYAAYKDYLSRLEAGESMDSIGYGAAHKPMVDALTDNKSKAALLARSLVGDYGAVSHYGQGIRNKVIPFYSWMEVNAKRYNRLIMNAFDQGIVQGMKTGGLTAAMLGARTTAYLGIRMFALQTLINIYNNLFHGDDEDKLGELERNQLHVILGHDKDGNIHTLRLQGSMSDFLGWFGYADAVAAYKEVGKGRGSYADVMKAVAKAPVNKIAGGLTPILKTPLELALGQSFFPDVTKPRPINDRTRALAQTVSAENEYDAIAGKATRGYWKSWLQAIDYSRNVGEISFNSTQDLVREFKESKGIEGAGSSSTPKSRLIREYKLAQRYGDESAAKKAMEKMQAEGITQEDMETSLLRASPLAGLSAKDKAEFMSRLTPKEQDQIKSAETWYKDTILSDDTLKSKYDFNQMRTEYNTLHKQEQELSKAGRYAEARKLKMDNDLYRKGGLVSRVETLQEQRKKVADSRLSADEKARRIANLDARIKEARAKALAVVGK